jgi:hypothetical protein
MSGQSTTRGIGEVAGWVAVAAVAGTVLIGLGAFWLSFTALTDLAVRAGISSGQAWVWPVIVDGLLVVSTISVVSLAPHGRRATVYPWTLLLAGAAVSVTGNAVHATVAADSTVSQWLAASIASVPPLVLLAITHLTVELTSRTARRPSRPESASVTTPAGLPPPSPAPAPTPAMRRPMPPAPVVADRRVQAAVRRGEGASNIQIARELQVHPSTVGRWLADPAGGRAASSGKLLDGAVAAGEEGVPAGR